MQNPLLSKFDLAPFSKIKSEHFEPAFKGALTQAKQEINKITENTATPSFENTIEALEASGEQLNRVASILFNLNSAETNTEIQQIAQKVSPWLSEFTNDLILNEALFARVKSVYKTKDSLDLSIEQRSCWKNLTPIFREMEPICPKKNKNNSEKLTNN